MQVCRSQSENVYCKFYDSQVTTEAFDQLNHKKKFLVLNLQLQIKGHFDQNIIFQLHFQVQYKS